MRMSVPKLKGFAVSWFFPPYVGSADLDFFKRIKDSVFSFHVVQAARDMRDERVLRYASADIERFEIRVDHKNPRTEDARSDFKRQCLSIFEARRHEYGFLISHSNEMVSHDVAAEIKRANPSIPWIAYFGDLFVRNPYVKYIPGYPLVQEDIAIERQTLRLADRIIVNNQYQKDLMFCGDLKQYEEKCVVIPHCFDPAMYPSAPQERDDSRFRFVHTGTLYHVKRTAEPLLRAVDRLIEVYPKYRGRFEVVFYGNEPTSHDISVHAFMRNRNAVRFEAPVGYLDSLRIMREADCLILIDGIFNKAEDDLEVNPFLPGKLMDYMGASRPIMAVTMPKGPTADILKASGNLVADERIDRIAYVMKRYIDRKVMPDYSTYLAYSAAKIGHQMDAVIASVSKVQADVNV